MEAIINNPGLQQITEKILFNLNYDDLKVCELINQSTKQILNDPFFWLRKLIHRGGFSLKNQEDWTNAIQLTKDTVLEKFVLLYLKKSSKNEKVVDIYCYIDEDFIDKFADKIKEYLKIKNPNAPDEFGNTPIMLATCAERTELVKILAPLTDTPNAPDIKGDTPIHWAAYVGA